MLPHTISILSITAKAQCYGHVEPRAANCKRWHSSLGVCDMRAALLSRALPYLTPRLILAVQMTTSRSECIHFLFLLAALSVIPTSLRSKFCIIFEFYIVDLILSKAVSYLHPSRVFLSPPCFL